MKQEKHIHSSRSVTKLELKGNAANINSPSTHVSNSPLTNRKLSSRANLNKSQTGPFYKEPVKFENLNLTKIQDA